MPPEVHQLLLKFADNHESSWDVAMEIPYNFDKLSPDIRERLLVKLADNYRTADLVAEAIKRNFDKLQPEIREQLLSKLIIKLANDEDGSNTLIYTIADNFEKLGRHPAAII